MAAILGWIVTIGIFVGWMSLIGNPHVVETSIGLVIAAGAGFWVYYRLSQWGKRA